MKKFLAMLLSGMMILTCVTAFATEAHEHTWGDWQVVSGGHSAVCTADGEEITAKHVSYSTSAYGFSASACVVCGYRGASRRGDSDEVTLLVPFEVIPEAQAVSTKSKPSSQRGSFVARGQSTPEGMDESILYAFTAAYTQNGALSTWKDVSTVSLPIGIELPEDYQLIRVSPSSGDDSVQNPEKWIEMESDYTDGVLTFTTKTPALYLIKNGK